MSSISQKSIKTLNDRVKSLLFETDDSISDIAKELCISYAELDKIIRKIGLSWVKDHRKKMSKGQTVLTSIVKKLLPGEKVINEYHIGQRLKLDVYCPKYKIAAEYHGIQHFRYVERFHDSKEDFLEGQKRDLKKMQLCKDNKIALIVFRYDDKLTEEIVYNRILSEIKKSEYSIDVKKKSITSNSFYQKAKKVNSDRKKAAYKQLKEKKKNDRTR